MKDKRKVFSLDNLGYEPEAGALHPGGTTAAVGDAVSGKRARWLKPLNTHSRQGWESSVKDLV